MIYNDLLQGMPPTLELRVALLRGLEPRRERLDEAQEVDVTVLGLVGGAPGGETLLVSYRTLARLGQGFGGI